MFHDFLMFFNIHWTMPSGSHRRPLDFWQFLCRCVGGFCAECCVRAFCFGQFLADLGWYLADYLQILVDFWHTSLQYFDQKSIQNHENTWARAIPLQCGSSVKKVFAEAATHRGGRSWELIWKKSFRRCKYRIQGPGELWFEWLLNVFWFVMYLGT